VCRGDDRLKERTEMSKLDLVLEPSVIFARNVDWNLFKIFYEIARRGGIGAAARSVNKQQPSVSAALQRLESHVGAPLCIRTSRGIELTVHGHQLFAACRAMYESVQTMPRAASAARGDIAGSVMLRVISNLHLQPKLTEILDRFHGQFPHIEINLDVAPWRDVLRSLKNGEVELGIGFEDEPDHRYLYLPITNQVQQLYCGLKHPLFGKPAVSPAQLVSEPFVVTKDEPIPYIRHRERHGLGRRIGGFADSLQERMWLIQLGMGIGFLPRPIVEASAFAEKLWPLLRDADAPVCTLYFMANASGIRSAPAQLLLDTALAHLRQEDMAEPGYPRQQPALRREAVRLKHSAAAVSKSQARRKLGAG
jgi:LysR family transcriptional regulator, transcriptional activator for bauABCD operon